MSEKHIIHHSGSPRHDEDDSWTAWLWGAGSLAVLGIASIIATYITAILATLAALAAVGGLGWWIWEIKKNTIKIGLQKYYLEFLQRSVRLALDEESQVKKNVARLTKSEKAVALESAKGRTESAIAGFNNERNALIALVEKNVEELEEAKRDVLKRASSRTAKDLKKAVSELNKAIRESKHLIVETRALDPAL